MPGTLLVVVFILNLFVWAQQSSSAIPFGTFFALISMWFGISVPLVFAGAVYGARKPLADLPLRTHQIPRQIPEQPWYLQLHVRFVNVISLPEGWDSQLLYSTLTIAWQSAV